jgi:hypothetical protein
MGEALGLKPPRVRSWRTRPDAAWERPRAALVTLDLDPPRTSRLLGVVETTGIQAVARGDPTWPRRPGQLARREFASLCPGVGDWLAAVAGRTGRVFGPGDRRPTKRACRHCGRVIRTVAGR